MMRITKATALAKRQDKLSMRKSVVHASHGTKIAHNIKLRVEKIAKAKGISMAQVALAWVMSQEGNRSSLIFFFCFFG
jgi:aryl-alcohol dehydrogenase-like predicted oxidoreductase